MEANATNAAQSLAQGGEPASLEIRLATAELIPAIAEISNYYAVHTPTNFAYQREPIDEWVRDWQATHQRFPWFVAIDVAGAVVGFAKSGPWKGRCAYHFTAEVSIYLRADCVGRGVGKRLYRRLFDLLRRQGYHSAIAGITQPNPASVALHESFGMKRVALLPQIGWKFDEWHDVGYWMVQLSTDKKPGTLRTIAEVDDAATAD